MRQRAVPARIETPLEQLASTVGRLDELVAQITEENGSIDKRIESEILAITGNLSLTGHQKASTRRVSPLPRN